jgi:arginine repressor
VTGTIAGDYTVLVVAPDKKTAESLRDRFLKLLR